jgi:putative tricarboxylic transport membrane protein
MSAIGKDVLAGLVLLVIAGLHAVQAIRLDMGTAFEMGPGAFPLLVSGLVGLIGVAVLVGGLRRREGIGGGFAWWPLLMVTLAVAAFAASVRPLGFVPAVALATLLSSLAQRPIRWGRSAVVALAVTLACWLVFLVGIRLSLPAFGPLLRF